MSIKNLKVQCQLVRGFGLSFAFPLRQLGYEPILIIQIGFFILWISYE